MSKLPLLQNQSAINLHNLALLATLHEHNPNFAAHAQSINDLFYFYVQHCTDNEDELLLSSTDIHNILEVVNTLQQLEEPVE